MMYYFIATEEAGDQLQVSSLSFINSFVWVNVSVNSLQIMPGRRHCLLVISQLYGDIVLKDTARSQFGIKSPTLRVRVGNGRRKGRNKDETMKKKNVSSLRMSNNYKSQHTCISLTHARSTPVPKSKFK